MELLLWRWSTAVQASSDVLIAFFFVAIALTLRRTELHAWVLAWLANLSALAVTISFWLLRPDSVLIVESLTTAYLFFKTMFVLLLAQGANEFRGSKALKPPCKTLVAAVAALSVVGALLIDSIDMLGVVQTAIIAVGLGLGALYLALASPRNYVWLITGFSLRALLSIVECVAYALMMMPGESPKPALLSTFVSVHSSFDTGAEWMIALGCVLTLYGTIRRELTAANVKLTSTQEQLHNLLTRDQLTGVLNRRALPTVYKEARSRGAAILFFDLDDFKGINDRHGHHVGDACLARFARVLQENFTAGDRVVRYAGDEFIVVTQDIEADTIEQRVRAVRSALDEEDGQPVRIRFSFGHAVLPENGDPEAILREADLAMYQAKAVRAAG